MIVEAIIEIPIGTKNKFEVNKENGKIKLDRVLYSSLTYPGEYGFIDNTLADDGDALDILVLSSFPTFPGCVVDARVIGFLDIVDNGFEDQKIIAVSDKDPRFDHIKEITDIPEHQLIEVKDFFKNYKVLQKIEVITKDFHSRKEAEKLINSSKKK